MKRVPIVLLMFFLVSCSAVNGVSTGPQSPTASPSAELNEIVLPTDQTRLTEVVQVETPASSHESPSIGCVLDYNQPHSSNEYLVISESSLDQETIRLLDHEGNIQKVISCKNIIPPEIRKAISPNGTWFAYYSMKAVDWNDFNVTPQTDISLNLFNLQTGENQVIVHVLSDDFQEDLEHAASDLQQEFNPFELTARNLYFSLLNGFRYSLSWSPDGKYLAFAGQMDGLSSDV